MPAILTSAEVPAVYVPSGIIDLDAAENSTGAGGATAARKFATGDTSTVPGSLNRNVASQEVAARYGGGANAVCAGLELSAGAGLTVAVSQGQCMSSGAVVQINASALAGLADNTRSWIWVVDNGDTTFAITNVTSTSRPTDGVVLLGSVLTASGSVASVDTSGVVYLKGGMPWRQTADTGAPTDSPSSSICLLTRTLAGDWVWDGTEWCRLIRQLAFSADNIVTNAEYVPAGQQVGVYEQLDVTSGTLDVLGLLRVIE